MTSRPLLSVQDLTVAFRQGGRDMLAVDRISFDVKPGETVSLAAHAMVVMSAPLRTA